MELSPNEQRLLRVLTDEPRIPAAIAGASDLGEQEAMSAASWLQLKGLAHIAETRRELLRLTDEGERYATDGLPERRAADWLAQHGPATLRELAAGPLTEAEAKLCIGWLKRKGWATVGKGDGGPRLTPTGEAAAQPDEPVLARLAAGEVPADELDAAGLKLLRGRKLLTQREAVERKVALTDAGRAARAELGDEVLLGEVTPEMLQAGSWRQGRFQGYSLDTRAPTAEPGTLHPMTRFVAEIRSIFLEMGFTEIEGDYIESAFWNMDVLFIPQDHPARELQDTLYLSDPATIALTDDELINKVSALHEHGGDTGSAGWGCRWERGPAERALLRTHTTVGTIRHLAEHPEPPVRVFSVGRVFRREAVDATHLPEFTQVEGIIMEPAASFAMLITVLREFYRRMGFDDVRVRPAYFPYTEPSLEVEVRFGGRWLELGGAGIFRPEVTAPFDIAHPVLAWGLGLERLAMLRLGLTDIRMLYQSDLEWLRENG